MGEATGLREYKGAAAATTLVSSITNSALGFSINASVNWPTGSGGYFSVVVDPGLSSEEKMLCTGLSAGTLTIHASGRGYDNTTAVAHLAGAVIYPVITAIDIAESNTIANFKSATAKTTPVDADLFPISDSAATGFLKAVSWANIKATIKTYLDGFYILKTLLTTTGDLMYASGANTPARLAIGSSGQSLRMVAGIPAWSNGTVTAKTDNYTFAAGDEFNWFSMNAGSAKQFSIPTDATYDFAIGTEFYGFWITGAGQPTIGAVTPGTTTVVSSGATSATPKIRAANVAFMARKLAANSWIVFGDLA